MKCETPFVRRSSPREPTPTKTLTLTDCAVGMGVVTTRMPLDSVETCHSMVIAGCVLPSLFCVQRPRLDGAAVALDQLIAKRTSAAQTRAELRLFGEGRE